MDIFSNFKESIFNLDKNKSICHRKRFVHPEEVTGSNLELFLGLHISQRFVQIFERYWKNSVCIRVNNFAKSGYI